MALDDAALRQTMVAGWKKSGTVLVTVTAGGKPGRAAHVVREDKAKGKTGAALAKVLGIAQPSGGDLEVFVMTGVPGADDVDLPKKKEGLYVFRIRKAPGFKAHGYLAADEKYSLSLRKTRQDKRVDGDLLSDKKAIELKQKQALIDHWVKNSILLARVIEVARPDSGGRQGYFSMLRAIKGKTPRQMEGFSASRVARSRTGPRSSC